MKRIYIDENLPYHLARHLAEVYRHGVQVRSCKDEGQGGVDDLDLIPHLGACGFEVMITKDFAQVDERPAERDALLAAGLSWVGVPDFQLSGARVVAEQLAVVLPAVGEILLDWPTAPTIYKLREPDHVFASVERVRPS